MEKSCLFYQQECWAIFEVSAQNVKRVLILTKPWSATGEKLFLKAVLAGMLVCRYSVLLFPFPLFLNCLFFSTSHNRLDALHFSQALRMNCENGFEVDGLRLKELASG